MEDLVSFETALALKEKGFEFNEALFGDHEQFVTYSGYLKYGRIDSGKWDLCDVYNIEYSHWGNELTETIDAPTLSLAAKWLRDLPTPIIITPTTDFVAWEVTLDHPDKGEVLLTKNSEGRWFNSYEEALEAGINKALTLI